MPFIELKQGAESTYAVRKHSHEELSFGFVEKGCSSILCKALQFELDVDQVILLPPDTIHLCQPDDVNKFIFKMIYVAPQWFSSVFHMDARTLTPQTAALNKNDIQWKDSYLSSFELFDDPLKAESDTILFMGNLIFDVFDIGLSEPHTIENEAGVSKVKDYMDEHYTEQILLDDLAALSGRSRFSLLRKFKAVHKLTPHAYLLNKRINLAKQLLLKGETIAMTAALCGFFDQSHFVKTFRQYVGVNPTVYK